MDERLAIERRLRELDRLGEDLDSIDKLLCESFTVMLGMVVTASNGTVWLSAAGLLAPHTWATAWMTWWTGDAVGALLGGILRVAATAVRARGPFGCGPAAGRAPRHRGDLGR